MKRRKSQKKKWKRFEKEPLSPKNKENVKRCFFGKGMSYLNLFSTTQITFSNTFVNSTSRFLFLRKKWIINGFTECLSEFLLQLTSTKKRKNKNCQHWKRILLFLAYLPFLCHLSPPPPKKKFFFGGGGT